MQELYREQTRNSLIKRLLLKSLTLQRSMNRISKPQSGLRTQKGKSKSSLRPQDIPKGVHIDPYGSNDLGKVWTVSEPQLTKTKDDRYAFGMHLFCSVPSSSFSQTEGACVVGVQVCYKPKLRN